MRTNVDANDKKRLEKVAVCKLNFPRYIQENFQPEPKQDILIFYLKNLLKGTLEKHVCAKNVRIISFKIKTTKRLMKDETDVNHGAVCIYVWRDEKSSKIKSYCIIRSKLSGAWQKVTGIRDLRFPFKFAQAFLKEKEMNNIKLNYLKGKSASSSTLHTSPVHFDPDEIMDNFGVVKEFTSSLKNDMLKPFVGENYVHIQIGQIKLKVSKNRRLQFDPIYFLSMIKIIDETLITPVNPWKVLNYIRIVEDFNLTKELKKNISKQMADYMESPDEQYSFDAESTLEHPHESFYKSKKELIYNQKVLEEWGGDFSVTIKSVLNLVKKKLDNRDNYSEEIMKIKLKFHDPISNEERTESFANLVRDMQILHTGNGKNTYFHHHKCWYELEQEIFFETNVRFVNIVKKCLVNEEKFKILRWSCHLGRKTKPPTFTLKEIYDFIKVINDKNEHDEEDCRELGKILTKEYSLFKRKSENGSPNNDFGSSRRNAQFNVDHSEKLLDLNCSLLEKSSLAKHFNNKSSKNETPSLQKFSKLLLQTPDIGTLMSELKKEKEFDNNKLEDIQKCLEKKQPYIVCDEEITDYYRVKCPYVTKSLLSKLEKLNICPIRLLQFLRMHFFQLQEGEYNELYHLSNCKCQNENSWKYIVGDRIISNENKRVELFDVMALNTEDQEAYLIHVKKGFDAFASRELSSQVSICGDQIWKSLSINSNSNMLKMFYKEAVTVRSDDNIHKVLTKQEVEDIGITEAEFMNKMKSNKMKYFICYSPCTSKTRKFSFLRKANLDHDFQESDFKDKDMIQKLQGIGILNERKITGDIFKSQEKLKKDHDFLRPVLNKLINKIGGADVRNFLSDSSSFVAKVTLIDLYQKFSAFIINGKQQLKLKILEIPSFEEKTKQQYITNYYQKVDTEINLKSEPSIKDDCQDTSFIDVHDQLSSGTINTSLIKESACLETSNNLP